MQLISPIIFILGVVALINTFPRHALARGLVYGFCLHIILTTSVAYILNLIFPTYLSAFVVFAIVMFFALLLRTFSNQIFPTIKKDIQHSSLVPALIIFLFMFSYLINIFMHSQKNIVIPIIGNNDDTATHLSMSIMTIKEGSLLFKNRVIEKLIARGVDYQNAAYYPPSVYTYVALLYSGLFLGPSPLLNLPLLFNVYAVFSFLIYFIFIFSIFDLAYGITKSISLWSVVPMLVFGIFFVAGEYFMVLYRMSYLSQILGNAFVLILYRMVVDVVLCRPTESAKSSPYLLSLSQLILGIFMVGVGLTYYLFIPIAVAVLPFVFYPDLVSRRIHAIFRIGSLRKLVSGFWVICLCTLLSLFPLALYTLSYSLVEQISIPGINLIILGSLIQFCLMTIVYVVLRNYLSRTPYIIGLTGGLVSLFVVLITTTPSMIKTGQLPYYYYKSFFTSASFAVAFGIVVLNLLVSQSVRYLHRCGYFAGLAVKLSLWVILPMAFVIYLYAYNTYIPGYKSITYLARGALNYYHLSLQEKLFSLYKTYYDKKIAVYNPGYWGENILLFSLFENMPQAHVDGTREKLFYFASSPDYYFTRIIEDYKSGKEVYFFDGHETSRFGLSK